MPRGAARHTIPPPPHPTRAPPAGRGPKRRAAKRVLLPPETYGFGVRNVSFRAPKPYLLPRPLSATAHPARRLRAFATPSPPRRARPAPDETGKNASPPIPRSSRQGGAQGAHKGRGKGGSKPDGLPLRRAEKTRRSGMGSDEMGVFWRKARSPAPPYAPRMAGKRPAAYAPCPLRSAAIPCGSVAGAGAGQKTVPSGRRGGGKRERGDGIASRDTVPPGHINYNKPMLNLYNVCRMKSVAYLARRGSTLRALPLAMRSTTMPRFCPTRARRPSMV